MDSVKSRQETCQVDFIDFGGIECGRAFTEIMHMPSLAHKKCGCSKVPQVDFGGKYVEADCFHYLMLIHLAHLTMNML